MDEMITVETDEICSAIKMGFNDTRLLLLLPLLLLLLLLLFYFKISCNCCCFWDQLNIITFHENSRTFVFVIIVVIFFIVVVFLSFIHY